MSDSIGMAICDWWAILGVSEDDKALDQLVGVVVLFDSCGSRRGVGYR